MGKKVIFTEKQMKEILGEDIYDGIYNDQTSQGTEYPVDSIPATDHEVIPTEPGGEVTMTDKYGNEKIANNMWVRRGNYALYEGKKKIVKNDNGEIVPEVCPKCGSKIGVYIEGEPIYRCSNKKCKEYFGTVPFPKSLQKEMDEMDKKIEKKKRLNERNAELDNKALYSLPEKIRRYATPDGEHDKIMKRLASGEKMTIQSLYRLRNELENSSNGIIKNEIDKILKNAQSQGQSLRNVHAMANPATNGKNINKNKNNNIIYDFSND